MIGLVGEVFGAVDGGVVVVVATVVGASSDVPAGQSGECM